MEDNAPAEKPAKRKSKAAEPPPEPERPFEEALRELEQLAVQMERGDLTLDQAVAAYERGIGLSRLCKKRLDEAEAKIQQITREAGLKDFLPEGSDE
ncbi:MAG: exodeoxyribonuclease VII small subunit [Candidatus Wallbacteria bacterium]|nr:exodeoxyribonuclease VII small subunit [Candidatus Wallbacteria bacterium]